MSAFVDRDPDREVPMGAERLAEVLRNLGKRHTGLRVLRPNCIGSVRILCDQDASWTLTAEGRLMPEPRSKRQPSKRSRRR